jgi:hypothetical protein
LWPHRSEGLGLELRDPLGHEVDVGKRGETQRSRRRRRRVDGRQLMRPLTHGDVRRAVARLRPHVDGTLDLTDRANHEARPPLGAERVPHERRG